MKVYLALPVKSRGLQRVHDALIRYAPPKIQIVENENEADLVILHIYGRHDSIQEKIERLKAQNKAYAMIQYCIRSTMKPNTEDWWRMWHNSRLVWSYYDLNKLIDDDLTEAGFTQDDFDMADFDPNDFPFYLAPLGVDTSVFHNSYHQPGSPFKILASSQHALSEGARECAFAVKEVGAKMVFIGHELRRGDDIVCLSNISDEELAKYYSQSEFVSGLRRTEGFELPVIEGFACGATPIVFDRPEMRQWFDGLAVFIKEGSRDEVIESLVHVFQQGRSYPVNFDKQIEIVKERFNWETIIAGFWERILV